MIAPIEQYEGLNITFQTTEDCNIRCKYCYEINKQPHTLPMDYAKRFIELIIDTDDPIGVRGSSTEWLLEQGIILDFIGGDALINPRQIEDIITYFQYYATTRHHRWAHRWRGSISTNGTLFNADVRSFMERYRRNLSIGVSIDGCPEIHDRNRVHRDGSGTMKDILAAWPWYYDWSHGDPQIKATLNRDSIPYMAESVRFLHEEMKVAHINMNFIFEDMGLVEDDYAIIDQQLGKIVEYLVPRRHEMYINMLSRETGCSDAKCGAEKTFTTGWCGGGNMPCITPNGNIYPCFRFTKITAEAGIPDMSIGDIWTGFSRIENSRIIAAQTREKISPPECFTCTSETGCAWCIGGVYSLTGKFYRPTTLCRIRKLITKWADKYWDTYDTLEAL